ncbi:MAG: hypothetical protein A3K19_11050 [Lentisphaerae bacterium RIFOXYB12_FULL_65_16]|nr:MAG: hypothetical protein A3K18_15080 [Lentisphaerae bacterium RIFOXYA12_64_32]OGV94367.1 MAG: hypothetical protein A3K19_11050 [Lentisphaerae bacterium RIFOXYB12_FULL_65_16]
MTQTAVHADAASILIVDDTPANLQVLLGMLKERGHRCRPAPGGRLALLAAANEPPDLILLDIVMPDMDGYAVCAELKRDPKLTDIPVLFISGLSETVDKVKAFGVGGVDYITKPFHPEEVHARVEAHLRLRRQTRELTEHLARLQELEHLRDSLVHMIVHDMRSPLMSLRGMLKILHEDLAETLNAEDTDAMQTAVDVSVKLTDMVSVVLDVSRLEAGQMPIKSKACDLRAVVADALHDLAGLTRQRHVMWEAPTAPVPAYCDPEVTGRIVSNLVGNAVKFTSKHDTITLTAAAIGGQVRVTVTDTGPGIPAAYHEKIFRKFGQVETYLTCTKNSTGLGLAFCKLAVEAQGGRIGVDSEEGKGSAFWFELSCEERGSCVGR